MKRIILVIKQIKNNRLKEYDKIIQIARSKDYEIISLRDYIEKKFNSNKKILILRHDIDHISRATKKMFKIEKKYSANASYYFRNSTFDPKLLKEIEEYGSESSLHFETIADFIKANPQIKTKEELFRTDFKEKCLNLLLCNIQKFRLLLNIPCTTIASHGEYENRLFKTPNNFLTENISTYKKLDIKLEAYNQDFIEKVTCYISDTSLNVNGGYRYGISPLKAIEKQEPFILFLTHPNHWDYEWSKNIKRNLKIIFRILLKGEIKKEERFKRI